MRFFARLITLLVFSAFFIPTNVHGITMERLLGRILLQVESKGEAWYLDPQMKKRVFLGRPSDAFDVMRTLGKGITNKDLARIASSDEKRTGDAKFARTFAGTIFLQVQSKGEAWYINPTDLKRYYLGTPSAAFTVMRQLGLGITNNDIARIPSDGVQELKKPDTGTVSNASAQTTLSAYAGSYRCWSYNVSGGGGGDCRLFAPIVLNKDGTYSVSSEKGTFTVAGDSITLSESKLRGIGKLIGGTQIRFEYDYNSWHHVITYLKESGAASTDTTNAEIAVQVTLEYPTKDSALNSIVDLELVPKGQDVKTATFKPTAIAVWDGDKRVTASFHKELGKPRTGTVYDVYANTGFSATVLGVLDLTKATGDMTAVIKVTGNPTSQAEQKVVAPPTGPEIIVEIDLVYSARDSSLGSMQFVVLVPEGEDPAVAVYKPMALAVWDGEKTINASFHKATNQIRSKAKYTVYADWGREMIKSGTLDLSAITAGPVKKVFETTISGSSVSPSAVQSTPISSSAPSKTYISVDLTLQYAASDASLDNVTRIGLVKQGETYDPGYGNLAGYGVTSQLVASFSGIEAGFIYDVYTSSYSMGAKKVGTLDLRSVNQNTAKTVAVQ